MGLQGKSPRFLSKLFDRVRGAKPALSSSSRPATTAQLSCETTTCATACNHHRDWHGLAEQAQWRHPRGVCAAVRVLRESTQRRLPRGTCAIVRVLCEHNCSAGAARAASAVHGACIARALCRNVRGAHCARTVAAGAKHGLVLLYSGRWRGGEGVAVGGATEGLRRRGSRGESTGAVTVHPH